MSRNRAYRLLLATVSLLALADQVAGATPGHRDALCASEDSRPWERGRPPSNAQAYRAAADGHPYYADGLHRPDREAWFSLRTHEVMLCRTGDRKFCEAEWWQFDPDSEAIARQGGSLCVPSG
jgi:hypothetical protein